MSEPPREIDGASVVLFARLDDRHHATGFCRHFVAGELLGKPAGLAICCYEGMDSFYLFYCDAEWNAVTDTEHATLEVAQRQAELEFSGVSAAWVKRKGR